MDEAAFDLAVDRIKRSTLMIGGAGAIAAAVLAGLPGAIGFLLGAVVSFLNFRWLKRLVDSLGATAATGRPPRARVAVLLGLRYLLLGAGAYAILLSSAVSLPAALAGLFVSVAAVVLEIIVELVYAR